jgi:hypothetical protein
MPTHPKLETSHAAGRGITPVPSRPIPDLIARGRIPLGQHRRTNWPSGSPPTSLTGILVLCSLDAGSAFPWSTFIHWELFPCSFGEWWWSVLHLGTCHAESGNLTSVELEVCKDSATEAVMAWQMMIWEQDQAGDRVGKTRRRLQR